ncbi:MAG: tetratricopeptide repeat protein [Xanthobacteraceae bacterium]
MRRGSIYDALGAADLASALTANPDDREMRRWRAYHYATSGAFTKAMADYEALLRSDPADAKAYQARGDLWLMHKHVKEAIADYRKAGEIEAVEPSEALVACRASASWTTAFFHCTLVAFDPRQSAENRAYAETRISAAVPKPSIP